jgi:hypothetical protein
MMTVYERESMAINAAYNALIMGNLLRDHGEVMYSVLTEADALTRVARIRAPQPDTEFTYV